MKTKKTVRFMLLAGCFGVIGCAPSGESDICTQAAMHLEACVGSSQSMGTTCDPTTAQRILNADCGALQNGTRSTSFNLWDWLWNGYESDGNGEGWWTGQGSWGSGIEEPGGHDPHGGGHDPHGGGHDPHNGGYDPYGGGHEPHGGHEPGHEPHYGEGSHKCYCDNWATILKDCCSHCMWMCN
jgi:hypothetical protein